MCFIVGTFGFSFKIDKYGRAEYFVRKIWGLSINADLNGAWPNSLVLRTNKYECSNAGNLSSPVMKSLRDLKRINKIWKYYMISLRRGLDPAWILASADGKEIEQSLMDQVADGDFDTSGKGEKERQMSIEQKDRVQKAIENSRAIQEQQGGSNLQNASENTIRNYQNCSGKYFLLFSNSNLDRFAIL